MKKIALFIMVTALSVSCMQSQSPNPDLSAVTGNNAIPYDNDEKNDKPKIDVVFALDATGSMSGLIQTAKEKIWSIALSLSQAKPTPELRIGMVFYRDRGDNFVTKILPLTEEIDFIYSDLIKITADGGGDEPESVNQALAEAISSFDWTQDGTAYKVVFLVGDCPPHMDYRDDQRYPATCKKANEKGIVINTIQLGNCSGTKEIWRDIASLTNGSYLHLEQDAEGFNIATPYDREINEIYSEIEDTKVTYGSKEVKEKEYSKKGLLKEFEASASEAANTRRALYNSSKLGKKNLYGGADLVNKVDENQDFDIDKIHNEQLPEEMQKMSTEEKKTYVQKKSDERKELMTQMQKLSEQREEYIEKELEKLGKAETNFSQQVFEIMQEQAETKDMKIEGKAKH